MAGGQRNGNMNYAGMDVFVNNAVNVTVIGMIKVNLTLTFVAVLMDNGYRK